MPHSLDLDRTATTDRRTELSLDRFVPREDFEQAIAPLRNDVQVYSELATSGRRELKTALWEIWHHDAVCSNAWPFREIDALSLLTTIAPQTGHDLHAELVVLSMLHRGPGRFPHARLLQVLDTRWDQHRGTTSR